MFIEMCQPNQSKAAGFQNIRIINREPYEFEYPTTRLYAFATKPQ